MGKTPIGEGFSVDSETLEKYWMYISDTDSAQSFRENISIQAAQRERVDLHGKLVKSAGFDPELRYQSDEKQKKSGFWDFNETLEDYITKRLAKEGNIAALNRRILGM